MSTLFFTISTQILFYLSFYPFQVVFMPNTPKKATFPTPPLDRREFERVFRDLRQHVLQSQTEENPGSHRCERCQRCTQCMFTTDSVDCFSCTYCSHCTNCTNCTHCSGCQDCHQSSYCVNSHNLSACSYVIMSEHCHECIFCFGCVGLLKKEFHILNQKYSRDAYFKMVAKLKVEFGIH